MMYGKLLWVAAFWGALIVGIFDNGSLVCRAQQETELPSDLQQVASDYAKAKNIPFEKKNVTSIYQIAKGLSNHDATRQVAMQIFHILSDTYNHLDCQVALGFYYAKEYKQQHQQESESPQSNPYFLQALKYFEHAGQEGPHQAALYNAGRLHASTGNWVEGLAFIQAAASMTEDEASYSDSVEETATEAFELLGQTIASQPQLKTRDKADIFLYANLNGFPEVGSAAAKYWSSAMQVADRIDQKLTRKENAKEDMETCVSSLISLWEAYSGELSRLQSYLVLSTALDFLLHFQDEESFIPAIAGYAEALALSPYCFAIGDPHGPQYTTEDEIDGYCFQKAAKTALKYYLEMSDVAAIQRIKKLINQHPHIVDKARLYDEL